MGLYRRVPLDPSLRPYLHALLIQEEADADPHPYRVLPGPFPVLGFQHRGQLAALRASGPEPLAVGGITGLQTAPRSFVPDPGTRSLLTVFTPTGATALLGHPMREFTDRHVALDAFLTPQMVRIVAERLQEARSLGNQARILQDFFAGLLDQRPPAVPPLVVRAVQQMLREPAMRVGAVAAELEISARQLERLFERYIGLAPKQFATVARFNAALAQRAGRRSWADVAHATGYADQSHLVRQFSRYAGTTPTRLAPEVR